MAIKFPEDYMPRISDEDPNVVIIPARPGLELPCLGYDEAGRPIGIPEQYHFIRLFLEDISKKKINNMKAARRLLGDLVRASILDVKGQYKGIYNAIQAIRVFLTTEDYYQYGEELKKTQKELDKLRDFLQSQDLGIARAERSRDSVKIEVKED